MSSWYGPKRVICCGLNLSAAPCGRGMPPFSQREQLQIVVPWTHGCHRPVERGELQAMHPCQMQQCGVGHLSITHDFRDQGVERTRRQCRGGFHIVMAGMCYETVEQMESRLTIKRHTHHLRIQRQTEKTRLREHTGSPACGRIAGEPAMRRVVMGMIAPYEGEQHVDIGQCNQKPSSSRHWRTLAGLMAGMSLLTTMTGSPLRTVRRTPAMASAWRTASPTNTSTVLPWAAAASVARWYSSSSSVNVDMGVLSSSLPSHTLAGPQLVCVLRPCIHLLSCCLGLKAVCMVQAAQDWPSYYSHVRW